MDSYCHDFKDYAMTGVSPSGTFVTIKNVAECDIDKDRHHQHYFKPVQQSVEALPPVFAGNPPVPGSGANLPGSSVPRYGTVIPNRVFVGGIDFKTKEEDLQKFFCSFGLVKDTKIIRDRAEVSKGYGFVTFESSDEADKVREQQDNLFLNGKKLNIGPAVRKQQVCFPKDIHVPGPPGSWILHPAGYASYTNANGITYFSPTSPIVASQLQPQAFPQAATMMYNGGVTAAYHQPVATAHYAAGYGFAATAATACNSQPYSAVHMPWNHPTQIGGACGQLVAPTGGHSGLEQLNVLSMTPAASHQAVPSHTGYLLPRSSMTPNHQLPLSTRPGEGQPLQHQDKIAYMPSVEPLRMLMPTSSAYVTPIQHQSLLHSPTAIYAQPATVKCGPQYMQQHGAMHDPTGAHSMLGQYGLITIPEGAETHSPMIASENDILTPPLTPDKPQ